MKKLLILLLLLTACVPVPAQIPGDVIDNQDTTWGTINAHPVTRDTSLGFVIAPYDTSYAYAGHSFITAGMGISIRGDINKMIEVRFKDSKCDIDSADIFIGKDTVGAIRILFKQLQDVRDELNKSQADYYRLLQLSEGVLSLQRNLVKDLQKIWTPKKQKHENNYHHGDSTMPVAY